MDILLLFVYYYTRNGKHFVRTHANVTLSRENKPNFVFICLICNKLKQSDNFAIFKMTAEMHNIVFRSSQKPVLPSIRIAENASVQHPRLGMLPIPPCRAAHPSLRGSHKVCALSAPRLLS